MNKPTLNLGITIVVGWLLMSCGSDPGNTGPTIGSESHFLETCVDGGCPSGLACVCGVCTTACDAAGVCGVEGATCEELPAFAEALSCTEGAGNVPRVCAFECDDDADCAPLGQAHICSNGLCHADATFVADDVEPDLISECAQPSPLASSVVYACNCGVESSADCAPGDDGAAGTATAPLQTLEAAIAATDFSTPARRSRCVAEVGSSSLRQRSTSAARRMPRAFCTTTTHQEPTRQIAR